MLYSFGLDFGKLVQERELLLEASGDFLSAETVAENGRLILERIDTGDLSVPFTARDIYHRHWARLDKKSVIAVLDMLVIEGKLAATKSQTGGRTLTTYTLLGPVCSL